MPVYKIKHVTHYYYDQPVYDSINQMMLYPFVDSNQNVLQQSFTITHQPTIETFSDKFGNKLGIFSLVSPHTELCIISHLEVEIFPVSIPAFKKSADQLWQQYEKYNADYLYNDFLQPDESMNIGEIQSLVSSFKDKTKSPLQMAILFSEYIFQHFTYTQGVTSVETDIDEIWNLKAGVCQDFAHFLLTMLRLVKIPARYVSGYICPGHDEWRGAGATHAWVEIFVPDYGWIGLDPTNNCIASDRHVRLAVGRYFKDCTPVKGIYKGKLDHRLEVSVTVENGGKEPIKSFLHSELVSDKNIPSFVSEVKSDDQPNSNSYQAFIKMQQQQQQQ